MAAPQKEFVESLNYPGKNMRPLAKWPISVPKDPFITDFTPFKGKKVAPKHFKYSLFFTAFDVRDYGPQIKKYMKIFAPLDIKKVYLETYRDGYTVDRDVIEAAKNALLAEKYEVSGAVTPTHFSDKVKNEFPSASGCFTDREANRKMKKVYEFTAGLFDEIIIDDWFFTACECSDCKKAKGKKTWQEYRSKLIFDVSKKYVIEPAKKVNKNVNIILKLPQWYERFYDRGYDLTKLIPLYDEIAVGTETRDFHEARFMPEYGSMFYRYIRTLAPEKVKKAWFDVYQCTKEIYTEQAFQSILGGAHELILFCAGVMPQPLVRPLVEELIEKSDKIDRLSSFAKLFSVPVIRETNTYGDELFTQYLMALGIPCYMTDKRNFKDKMVVLTAQSAHREDYSSLFNHLLKQKKYMFITSTFAKELKKYFHIEQLKEEVKVDFIAYKTAEAFMENDVYITHEINNGKRIALVNNAYSFISVFKIKESNIWVLNMPYTTDEITTHSGDKISENFRFLMRNEQAFRSIQSAFDSYANIKLYEAVKTFYKYKV
jgi:hypothetical protein